MTELYHVTTVVRKYGGRKNVGFHWFLCEETTPRPYADLIENYDPSNRYAIYAEVCIDEMFALDQANALKEYLDRNYGDAGTTTIGKAELPIANDAMGAGAMPAGGGVDFYRFDKNPIYSLPFKVWGYFGLRHCEPADDSGRSSGSEHEPDPGRP